MLNTLRVIELTISIYDIYLIIEFKSISLKHKIKSTSNKLFRHVQLRHRQHPNISISFRLYKLIPWLLYLSIKACKVFLIYHLPSR